MSNIFGSYLLESPELPVDFFDSTLKEMIAFEKELIYIDPAEIAADTIKEGIVPVETSCVASVRDGTISIGYKYPQQPSYRVIADLGPAQDLFQWIKQFYSGGDQPFPVLGVSDPIIPHSRYEKRKDTTAIDVFFLSKGFKILKPTVGQFTKFAPQCIEHRPKFVVTRRLTFKQQEVFDKYPFIITIAHSKTHSFFFLDKQCCLEDFFKTCRDNLLVVHKDKLLIKMLKRYCRRRGFLKFYTRYYDRKYDSAPYAVVASDYNPYSPYGVSDLIEFTVQDGGLLYKKKYKDSEVTGYYSFFAKRYHPDIWYPNIFSEHHAYNKTLMSFDLITNAYCIMDAVLEKNVRLAVMTVPFLLEPFHVVNKYCKPFSDGRTRIALDRSKRSPLPYRDLRSPPDRTLNNGRVYVPYLTQQVCIGDLVRLSDGLMNNYGVIPIRVIADNSFTVTVSGNTYVKHPRFFFDFVSEVISWYNQKKIRKDVYDSAMLQFSRYYVSRRRVVNGKYVNRGSKMDDIVTFEYDLFREALPGEKYIECEKIPYRVSRYPSNRWGSICADFSFYTLEEFRFSFDKIREKFRAPPWMHQLVYDPVTDGKHDFEFGAPIIFAPTDEEAVKHNNENNNSWCDLID